MALSAPMSSTPFGGLVSAPPSTGYNGIAAPAPSAAQAPKPVITPVTSPPMGTFTNPAAPAASATSSAPAANPDAVSNLVQSLRGYTQV